MGRALARWAWDLALVVRKSREQDGNANGENFLGFCKRDLGWLGSGEGKANLKLPFDTGCHYCNCSGAGSGLM